MDRLQSLLEKRIPWLISIKERISRAELNSMTWRQYKELIKSSPAAGELLEDRSEDFDVCHHCRKIIPADSLLRCKYRGHREPQNRSMNNIFTDFKIDKGLKKDMTEVYSGLYCRHGKFYFFANFSAGYAFCMRKFCLDCLESVFEVETKTVIATKWQCKFCTGQCTCTRCTRNISMNKLYDLYHYLGGKYSDIAENSLYEQLLIAGPSNELDMNDFVI